MANEGKCFAQHWFCEKHGNLNLNHSLEQICLILNILNTFF